MYKYRNYYDLSLIHILYKSLLVKKAVVEQDEKEENLRKILNFGHTLGHGIETVYGLHDLLHGECVAIGMIPMLEDEALKERVLKIYQKLGLKSDIDYDPEEMCIRDSIYTAGKYNLT